MNPFLLHCSAVTIHEKQWRHTSLETEHERTNVKIVCDNDITKNRRVLMVSKSSIQLKMTLSSSMYQRTNMQQLNDAILQLCMVTAIAYESELHWDKESRGTYWR